MMSKKKIIFLLLINYIFFFSLNAEITNKIIVKVGNEIVTSLDLQNEIMTNLTINKMEINQNNIDEIKNYSIKNLINKKIKQIEIKKYNITEYSKNDINKYLTNIASEKFNTNVLGLKNIFQQNNISFEIFSENFKTELLWNTLIYSFYKNQMNINMLEIENEIKKYKDNEGIIDLTELKEKLLNQKKEEKLQLFSRSHFSNLESSIEIIFQ